MKICVHIFWKAFTQDEKISGKIRWETLPGGFYHTFGKFRRHKSLPQGVLGDFVSCVDSSDTAWLGSNDDSDDRKFWKPSPFCPSNIIAWLPSVQDSWGILLTRLIFKWECFLQGTATANKRPFNLKLGNFKFKIVPSLLPASNMASLNMQLWQPDRTFCVLSLSDRALEESLNPMWRWCKLTAETDTSLV